MNEQEREAIIEQGRQAKTILDTPLFSAVLDEMRAACMERIESVRTGHPDDIMPIWRQLKSINMLKENLVTKLSSMAAEQHNRAWDEKQ